MLKFRVRTGCGTRDISSQEIRQKEGVAEHTACLGKSVSLCQHCLDREKREVEVKSCHADWT